MVRPQQSKSGNLLFFFFIPGTAHGLMWDHKQARTFVHPTRSQLKLVNDTCPGTGGCRNQSAAKRLFADLEMKDVLWMNPEQVGKR